MHPRRNVVFLFHIDQRHFEFFPGAMGGDVGGVGSDDGRQSRRLRRGRVGWHVVMGAVRVFDAFVGFRRGCRQASTNVRRSQRRNEPSFPGISFHGPVSGAPFPRRFPLRSSCRILKRRGHAGGVEQKTALKLLARLSGVEIRA